MSFYSGHKCCKTENISLINIYKRERDRLLRAMFSISVLPGAGKIQGHRGHCYDHASHGHWTSFLGCHEGNCHDYESLGNWSIGKALAIWKVPGCGGHCHDHESLGHLAIWKALVVWATETTGVTKIYWVRGLFGSFWPLSCPWITGSLGHKEILCDLAMEDTDMIKNHWVTGCWESPHGQGGPGPLTGLFHFFYIFFFYYFYILFC